MTGEQSEALRTTGPACLAGWAPHDFSGVGEDAHCLLCNIPRGRFDPKTGRVRKRPHGLVFSRSHKLGYGWGFGFGAGWLPDVVQRGIVGLWNPLACRIWGHEDVMWHAHQAGHFPKSAATCCDCLALLDGCSGRHEDERRAG